VNDIVAADKEGMYEVLHRRADRDKRRVDELDFLGNTLIPAQLSVRSRSTEGDYNLKESKLNRYPSLVAIFNKRPVKGKASERQKFWRGEGAELRLDHNIFHVTHEIDGRPSHCIWCGCRPRKGYLCMFCGETLCEGCEPKFHADVEGFEIPVKNKSNSKKKVKLSDDAAMRQPDMDAVSPAAE